MAQSGSAQRAAHQSATPTSGCPPAPLQGRLQPRAAICALSCRCRVILFGGRKVSRPARRAEQFQSPAAIRSSSTTTLAEPAAGRPPSRASRSRSSTFPQLGQPVPCSHQARLQQHRKAPVAAAFRMVSRGYSIPAILPLPGPPVPAPTRVRGRLAAWAQGFRRGPGLAAFFWGRFPAQAPA